MKKIERLRISAVESCNFQGHKMKPFSRKYRHWWSSECRICGMGVYIDDEPAPNSIDVSGEAVALNCKV